MGPAAFRSAAFLVLAGSLAINASALREAPVATIGIIIDDLGNSLVQGRRAVRLPGAVACAILPKTPYSATLARKAHANQKEVILHLPMESTDGVELGPGGLDSKMGAAEIAAILEEDLQTVPHAVAVSNHMGSLLTRQPESMRWFIQAVAQRGNLFFVDSRTTPYTVAADLARELDVPYLVRNVFLDQDRGTDAIEREFERLLNNARRQGKALAIAHPYPETLALLERRLPTIGASGVRLVAPSQLLELAQTDIRDRSRMRMTQ
ncbi:MAG: divergent polysaccharide deacetylase family protein [Acidiferrobacterales bacterium]